MTCRAFFCMLYEMLNGNEIDNTSDFPFLTSSCLYTIIMEQQGVTALLHYL